MYIILFAHKSVLRSPPGQIYKHLSISVIFLVLQAAGCIFISTKMKLYSLLVVVKIPFVYKVYKIKSLAKMVSVVSQLNNGGR